MIDTTSPRDLTDEQLKIVQHHEGPALVFAVAGAGKTTSMVFRIRYLVERHNVDPGKILATSFSKATVEDLKEGVHDLGVGGVECRTLHSLGRQFIQMAEERNRWPKRLDTGGPDPSEAGRYLASRAIKRLAEKRSIDDHDLEIEREDLEDQIASWKAQLCYADLEEADLPDRALEHATQAKHDNEDFVTLYQYYEKERAREGWITFDDMLLEGWEALMRFDDVRTRAQGLYDQVLVDEFQDISRVQYLMLDVLTEPHRNYMAIGDDDQCIYEWRGADPSFILDFQDEYEAEEYLIKDNFRSRVQQTALANSVIEKNENRRDKRIHLTQGFDGRTNLVGAEGTSAEAEYVVDTIQTRLQNGWDLQDMVILVRQYAQTAFIEQNLISNDLPYRIVGNVPFYRRREVKSLLRYLFWATLERTVREEGWFEEEKQARRYIDRFRKVIREPNRYVSKDVTEEVCKESLRRKTSITELMALHLADMHERTAERVENFLDTIDDLIDRLDEPADETIKWLIDDIEYEEHIRERSAFEELADQRVKTARSLIKFAEGHQSAQSLLNHVKKISFDRPERGPEEEKAIEICSIHRAKGREWPIVFIPGCNDGTIPAGRTSSSAGELGSLDDLFSEIDDLLSESDHEDGEKSKEDKKDDVSAEDIEEERRLFYVAITRAKKELNISYDQTDTISPFLKETDAEEVLSTCEKMRVAVGSSPSQWGTEETVEFCVGVGKLRLDRYLKKWWNLDQETQRVLSRQVQEAESIHEEASEKMEKYHQEKQKIQDSGVDEADSLEPSTLSNLKAENDWLEVPVRTIGQITPHDERFEFAYSDEKDFPVVFHEDKVKLAGVVEPDRTPQPLRELEDKIDWEDITARFGRVSNSGKTIYLRVDWNELSERPSDDPTSKSSNSKEEVSDTYPEPPGPSLRKALSDAFETGKETLSNVLGL